MLVDINTTAVTLVDTTGCSLDSHPLRSSVGDFIAALQELEGSPITTARVLDFLSQTRPSAEALAPYILWSSDHYTRNLIYRDQFFEVLALCWLPGQHTPVHTHDGQLGWVTMVQGELDCRDYRFVRPPLEERSDPTDSQFRPYFSARSRRVDVELLASTICVADGSVVVVDRRRTTHQIANLEHSRHGSVSLHIYSKPIERCVQFDETSRCWERRPLQYHNMNGVLPGNAA
ncbi:MAG TPA: cysteine dioxygenase family protein [Terriglobales bacterium]|nr:cysteine dioxygenase family protein [Terriglobales bacterium]